MKTHTGFARFGDIELAVEYEFDEGESRTWDHSGHTPEAIVLRAWAPSDTTKTNIWPLISEGVKAAMETSLCGAMEAV
jgi:hypothetical protein